MILDDRIQLAFYDGAIDNEAIGLCAAISAKDHGDARKAIELLRAACNLCGGKWFPSGSLRAYRRGFWIQSTSTDLRN